MTEGCHEKTCRNLVSTRLLVKLGTVYLYIQNRGDHDVVPKCPFCIRQRLEVRANTWFIVDRPRNFQSFMIVFMIELITIS